MFLPLPIFIRFRNQRISIQYQWKSMYRKNSERGKSASVHSYLLAKKIYCSSRTLEKKKEENRIYRSNHVSIHHEQNKYFFNQLLTKRKASCHFPKTIDRSVQDIQYKQSINIPAFKKTISESTAQDFAEKIKKTKDREQDSRKKIRSYLYSRSRSKHEDLNTIEKQYPTVSYEQQYSQNVCTQRKIFQCKIIKSPAIPFPFPKQCTTKRKRFQSLMPDTQNISAISIKPDFQFMSPESQQFIQEI